MLLSALTKAIGGISEGEIVMKHKRFSSFKEWWKRNWRFSITNALIAIVGITINFSAIYLVLNSNYHVEHLEYVDADFEWVDDFQNYEVVIVHEEKPHYLTVSDNKVKFIYTDEDFLNFVVVDHSKRVYDGQDKYTIANFYINLNYKETQI